MCNFLLLPPRAQITCANIHTADELCKRSVRYLCFAFTPPTSVVNWSPLLPTHWFTSASTGVPCLPCSSICGAVGNVRNRVCGDFSKREQCRWEGAPAGLALVAELPADIPWLTCQYLHKQRRSKEVSEQGLPLPRPSFSLAELRWLSFSRICQRISCGSNFGSHSPQKLNYKLVICSTPKQTMVQEWFIQIFEKDLQWYTKWSDLGTRWYHRRCNS